MSRNLMIEIETAREIEMPNESAKDRGRRNGNGNESGRENAIETAIVRGSARERGRGNDAIGTEGSRHRRGETEDLPTGAMVTAITATDGPTQDAMTEVTF